MREAPRVAHILEATVGGTGRHLTEIGCELAGLGIPQEALLSRRAEESFDSQAERLARAGVRLTWVPMTREIAPGADLRALWLLVRCLRRSRPDVVHTHSSKAGILGRAAAVLAGVPVIVHSPHAFPFQMRVGRARRALYLALERAAARKTTCLVAVSNAERDLAVSIAGYPEKRAVVIENGVDPEGGAPPEEGEALRQELGIAPETPVVLFVGRLVEQKAPDVLVRAAALVLARHPDALFLLAGAGPHFETVQRQVARWLAEGPPGINPERVRLLGHRQDIERFYAAAQIFVLPSRWEGLPYAPLEAMRAGIPVVASDLPPLREMVVHQQTGLLVPPDDPEALAGALSSLLSAPEWARALGRAGQARVCERFSLRRQVEQLALVYRTLAR
ncbi:MAG TPA: glycosyltransferase family 4 protein [Armatimonadota bacterium]|nr:glycosyltransferase family 4 protein [Armatimonadota bacterium]HPT96487.1 glycosyltransferase family 4 protein [Armatimonadota bacterium]